LLNNALANPENNPAKQISALRRNPTTCPKGQLSQRGGFWLA
jgi:hypothetical protein